MSSNESRQDAVKRLAKDVMDLALNSLMVELRFMDRALDRLDPVAGEGSYAVDGTHIFYSPRQVLEEFKEDKNSCAAAMLHMVFHCVFRHMYVSSMFSEKLWNLACDVAVELISDELQVPCIYVKAKADNKERRELLADIRAKLKYPTAEKIYDYFSTQNLSEDQIARLSQLFFEDDHSLWYDKEEAEDPDDPSCSVGGTSGGAAAGTAGRTNQHSSAIPVDSEEEEVWKNIAARMEMDLLSFSRQQGDKAGSLVASLRALNREKYDYEAFLRKFTVLGEAMKLDVDQFDQIFYTYGLNLYKKVPLIEPLEYKDVKKIKDFVIAIDTSGSVSGALVQNFVQKTWNILMQQQNFFARINLHIIQCDARVQEHVKITTKTEFENYISNMELKGFGGTDFRPAFNLVDSLIAKGEFSDLRGLIYFTDGRGEYPASKPGYEAAFVFVDDDYEDISVPPWAVKLVLQTSELN